MYINEIKLRKQFNTTKHVWRFGSKDIRVTVQHSALHNITGDHF